MNLHPHVHSLVPDGLFVPAADGLLTFVPLPAPTDEEIEALALKIARRLTAVVERRCDDAFETDALLEQTAAALQQALAVAVKAPVPHDQLCLAGHPVGRAPSSVRGSGVREALPLGEEPPGARK